MPKYKQLEDCKKKNCNLFTQKMLTAEKIKLDKLIKNKCGSSNSNKSNNNIKEAFKKLKCSEKIVKKSKFYTLREKELRCISSKCKTESNRAMKINMELLSKKMKKRKSKKRKIKDKK